MQITVDPSAVLAVLLNEKAKPALIEVTEGADLQSPRSLPWEIGNALSALVKRRRISIDQAMGAWKSYEGIPIRLTDVDLPNSLALAAKHDIYAYDAYVLESAKRYRSPLLSLDKRQCDIARLESISVVEVKL